MSVSVDINVNEKAFVEAHHIPASDCHWVTVRDAASIRVGIVAPDQESADILAAAFQLCADRARQKREAERKAEHSIAQQYAAGVAEAAERQGW